MGKHIVNTATSYRFIAGLGILGLVAAVAIAQTTTGQFLRSTFHGVNAQPSLFTSSTQPVTFTSSVSQTATTAFFSPSSSALPLISGFINPFTGTTVQSALGQSIALSVNGTSVSSSTSGGTGTSVASGGTLSGSIVSGTAGSGLSSSGAGSSGGGFTVLPSISSFSSGGNSLSGGTTSAKGSFCGGYGN
jgi:hypothetical protein